MAYYSLMLIILITCPLSWAANKYIPVSVCPPGAREWQYEADRKKCQQPTPDYLCAAIENWPGHYGEICTKHGLSPSGTCIVLNNNTHNVDSVPCKAKNGCPDRPYSPKDLFNWPICFGDFYGKSRTTLSQTTTKVQETTSSIIFDLEGKSEDSGLIIFVMAILLILALVGLYILYKRFNWELGKREIQEDDTENICLVPQVTYEYQYISSGSSRLQVVGAFHARDVDWKLAALKYYLVLILQHYRKIEELKDATILFKTSLLEHFGEALFNPLCNLDSSDDFQNLDISLVYNLLRNVCKDITHPKRGWGYEPSDDDVELGADIERIRSIWNKYCDGETKFLHLNDILVRMIDRFGNISDDVEFQDARREKILSYELKSECQEEHGVVLTKSIKAVVDILEKENCVVMKGALGSGKSTCLKYLERLYRRNEWEIRTKDGNLPKHVLCVGEKGKLLCCDNLFGMHNRGNFSGAADTIDALENIEQKVNHKLRVVLAIHDHVYEELQKSHAIKVLQNKRVVVDFNKISDAEMLLIFNEQRKHGHCEKHRKCWFETVDFESLKGSLKENPGKLGDPIVTLIYSNHHDIFAKKGATQDIVKELCTIFQNMLERNPDLLHVLLYVMFVETHKLDADVTEWASELGGINSKTVKQNVCHLDAFLVVQDDGKMIKIKHELISFALFKFCADHTRIMTSLLKHCRFQMIEEIIRPESSPDKSEFCVILTENMFHILTSRIEEENLFFHLKFHPLMENSKFVKKQEPLVPKIVKKKNLNERSSWIKRTPPF